ncbi:hypothetical protein GCM10009548_87410 [Streptomyces malaysiensis subsp. malaysiensis]
MVLPFLGYSSWDKWGDCSVGRGYSRVDRRGAGCRGKAPPERRSLSIGLNGEPAAVLAAVAEMGRQEIRIPACGERTAGDIDRVAVDRHRCGVL